MTTVWFTGLPSAGKTTLARGVAARLRSRGGRPELLDGDDVRAHFFPELGFTKDDRNQNVLRVGKLAELLGRHGVLALVSLVSPYSEARGLVRETHARAGIPFVEVFVDAPLPLCIERDVKGLYARGLRGELRGLTGIDDPYEPPAEPDVHLLTGELSIDAATTIVMDSLEALHITGKGLH